MDTLEFFRAVLPETGPYYLAYFKGDTPYPYHVLYPSLETLAEKALSLDAPGTNAVYHACASYKEAYVLLPDPKKPGETKKFYRVPENLGRMKAFWADIDCGPDKAESGKGYATKNEARDAVFAFCRETGLPQPLIVSSGGGLHCYWPLTRDIGPNSWRTVAEQFKAALARHGVLADRSRTADGASILRPPGTYNRKDPANPRLVKVLFAGQGPVDPKEFATRLQSAQSVSTSTSFSEGLIPAYVQASTAASSGNGLAEHAKYDGPPASIAVVAQHCQQVARMRDTLGDVSYEVWRGVIGIIKHCSEGPGIARDWSAEREATGHESLDWQKRYDTWDAGPTSCEFFAKHEPDGCAGCPHRDARTGEFKYTSPITLGHVIPQAEIEAQQVEVVQDGSKVMLLVPPKPEGFAWEGGAMRRYVTDRDGIVQRYTFSPYHFYLTRWCVDEEGGTSVTVRQHLPRGGIMESEIDTKHFASAAKSAEALAAKGVTMSDTKDSGTHLTAYLKVSLAKLKDEADQYNTLTSLGWKHDFRSFLIGNRLYRHDGTIVEVRLGGMAAGLEKVFPAPKGTLAGYCDAVNEVYAHTGMEPMQYAFANAFGSILTPFSGETLYRGVLFAVTGPRTAKGKTTVAYAGLYAFGDAARMTHLKKSTVNGRYGIMGGHNNLSLLYDEFTDIDASDLSEWAYTTSEGREKTRMMATGNGVRMGTAGEWMLSPYVTANTNLHSRLAQHRVNTEAEAVRIVEIPIENYPMPPLNEGMVTAALRRMGLNSGCAGERFIEWVVTHRDDVLRLAGEIRDDLLGKLPGVEYRFYRAHAVCTLTAAKILVDLNIVGFDFDALTDFTLRWMREMVESVQEVNTVTIDQALGRMINDMAPQIITTINYGNGRYGTVEDCRPPSGGKPVVGRYVRGGTNTPRDMVGKLYLSLDAFNAWCEEHRMPAAELRKVAKEMGVLVNATERKTLTAGTSIAGVQQRVLTFDLARYNGDVQLEMAAAA